MRCRTGVAQRSFLYFSYGVFSDVLGRNSREHFLALDIGTKSSKPCFASKAVQALIEGVGWVRQKSGICKAAPFRILRRY